jgi:hypothetical protein
VHLFSLVVTFLAGGFGLFYLLGKTDQGGLITLLAAIAWCVLFAWLWVKKRGLPTSRLPPLLAAPRISLASYRQRLEEEFQNSPRDQPRRSEGKWCEPKLMVRVKHLAGSKTLRHHGERTGAVVFAE